MTPAKTPLCISLVQYFQSNKTMQVEVAYASRSFKFSIREDAFQLIVSLAILVITATWFAIRVRKSRKEIALEFHVEKPPQLRPDFAWERSGLGIEAESSKVSLFARYIFISILTHYPDQS
jgi:hypothetical protein